MYFCFLQQMDSEDFCDRMEVEEFRQGLQDLWGDKEFADVEIVVSVSACILIRR